jgi:hypothetical protein
MQWKASDGKNKGRLYLVGLQRAYEVGKDNKSGGTRDRPGNPRLPFSGDVALDNL